MILDKYSILNISQLCDSGYNVSFDMFLRRMLEDLSTQEEFENPNPVIFIAACGIHEKGK